LGGNDAVPGMSPAGPGQECSQWVRRGREGGGVTRAISPQRLSHTWEPLGATKRWDPYILTGSREKRNAEAAIEQRVLSAQRGALQRGRPHPLSSLLHLRPSSPCPAPPSYFHHCQRRLQQGRGWLLLLHEAETEESGFCCPTFAWARAPCSGSGRRVILFSLYSFLHKCLNKT